MNRVSTIEEAFKFHVGVGNSRIVRRIPPELRAENFPVFYFSNSIRWYWYIRDIRRAYTAHSQGSQ